MEPNNFPYTLSKTYSYCGSKFPDGPTTIFPFPTLLCYEYDNQKKSPMLPKKTNFPTELRKRHLSLNYLVVPATNV